MKNEIDMKSQILNKDKQYQQKLQKIIKEQYSIEKAKTIKFSLTGSGCRGKSNLLDLPIFRISVCFGLLMLQKKQTLSIMITASHNPASDNGIKVGYPNDNSIPVKVFKQIQQCLNSQKSFQQYVNRKLQAHSIKGSENKKFYCFIGKDARITSPKLSQIVLQTMNWLSINCVDIGVCTTPEIFSFTKYILEEANINQVHSQQNLQILMQKYVDQALQAFQHIWKKMVIEKQNKQKILLDFSNGSGAISYKRYEKKLSQYFIIDTIYDKQFSKPNYKCGADYFYNKWHLTEEESFKKYDECSFFDGDSDRIVSKVRNCKYPFDGNYFLVFYVKTLRKIFHKLRSDKIINDQKQFNLKAVSTFMVNIGVKQQLKKMNINLIISNVGVQNIFAQASKQEGTAVFFQPNGHGGIYFSEKTLQIINSLYDQHQDNFQLQMLRSMYIILKNNSRGYGLHNMLMFHVCKRYLKQENLSLLFQMAQQITKNIYLDEKFDGYFKNGQDRDNQLAQPKNIVAAIDRIIHENKDFLIIVRKSATEKALIRVTAQGKDLQKCEEIILQIQKLIQEEFFDKIV